MRKRVLSLCVALALCLSLLPIPALAAEVEGNAGEYVSVPDWDEICDTDMEIPSDTAILMDADQQSVYEELKHSMHTQLVAFYAGNQDCVTLSTQASSREEALELFRTVFIRMSGNYPESLYFMYGQYWNVHLTSEDETNWTISFTPSGAHWDLLLDAFAFYSAVDQACLECFGSADGINNSMTDLEKIVSAHDWLSACCRYDPAIKYGLLKSNSASWTAPDGNVHTYNGKHGAYPALVWRNAECGGYAKAFKVLMDRVGVNCYIASGENPTTGSTHAWNVVELDGNWYHVDCTGDSTGSDQNVYDYAGRINRNWLLVSDEERAKSGYEWTTEYNLECLSSYTLPDALKNAGSTPVIFSNGNFYLADKNGTLLQYTTGSDFASGRELVDLGFKPKTGVCDRQTNTLYYTKESAGNPVSIWSCVPGESDAAVNKFDEVGDYTACGLYADAIGNGQTMLRAVYCYQTVKSWTLGERNSGVTTPTFPGGSGTEDDPYQISSSKDLHTFAELVNACNTDYNAAHYILTADIDLGGIDSMGNGIPENAWTPIGKTAESILTAFKGSFNGQGHTISGMYVQGGNYVGLFSGVSGGEIKNLNVSGIVEGGSYVGGLCGCSASAITNCSSDVRVTASGSYVGGIVGYNYLHPIESCISSGNIRAEGGYVGGIVGRNENSKLGFPNKNYGYISVNGTITDCRNDGDVYATDNNVGGLLGYDSSGIMTRCINAGNITGHAHYVGGLTGYCRSAELSNNYNVGNVYGDSSDNSYGVSGLVGLLYESNITDCYNKGTVIGLCNVVGGLCGYQYAGVVERCYNTGRVTGNSYVGGLLGLAPRNETPGYIRNSYNTALVTGRNNYIGGIVGSILGNFTVEYSYNIGEVTGKRNLGGVVGSTVDSGTIISCYFLETSGAGNALNAIGLNDGGSIDDHTGSMAENEFADWGKFKLWDNNLWAIEGNLALSNSPITTRPVLRSIGERKFTPQIVTLIHNGNTVTVKLICLDTDVAVFCGAYNNNGRMVAVHSAQITSESNYQFQFDGQQFDYAKVFILDSNFCPLCEAQRT